jgi:hypothetical protein
MPNPPIPSPSSVLATLELVVPRPGDSDAGPDGGTTTYSILRTDQVDEYEVPPTTEEILADHAAIAAFADDNFKGTTRRVAKISIADARVVHFTDLQDLIESLTPAGEMIKLAVHDRADSDRVGQERRNVRVRAFMYAASREKDNDFHVILGRAPDFDRQFMTVEISGLPSDEASPHRRRLKTVRDKYKKFFANHPQKLPGTTYDFYVPPIPVLIGGSL